MKPKNILVEDVLQAYNELGGIDYLRSQPALLQRILLKIANAPDPSPTIVIDMSTYAPWMDWRQRLSYKRNELALSASSDAHGATDVEAKVIEPARIESSPPTDAPEPQSWKEPEPDGLAKTMRLYDPRD